MFDHIALEEIDSTQSYLRKLLSEKNLKKPTLVSAKRQTAGHGRKQRAWQQVDNSICMSFNLSKRDNPTLSTLEISCHLHHILRSNFNFSGFLKWPNDIYDRELKKCGGILIDLHKDQLVVGIGINLGKNSEFGHIGLSQLKDEDFHQIPEKIYQYILEVFPQQDQRVSEYWTQYCCHIDKEVAISDDKEISGIFKGIGEYGEALILDSEKNLIKVFNGTLRFAQST